jgi:ferricrocin synthase
VDVHSTSHLSSVSDVFVFKYTDAGSSSFLDRATHPLDCEHLALAWRTLRARHSILRTTFASPGPDEVHQVVLTDAFEPDATYSFTELDGPLEPAVRDFLRAEARLPSDMFTPPVRLRHLRVAGQDVVVLTLQHALYG